MMRSKKSLVGMGLSLLISLFLVAGNTTGAEASNPASDNTVVLRPEPTGEHTVCSTAPGYGLACAWSQYYEYISGVSPTVAEGKISVTVNVYITTGSKWDYGAGEFVKVWVDFNGDKVFGAGETILSQVQYASKVGYKGTLTYTGSATIPPGAVSSTYLRASLAYSHWPPAVGSWTWGDVEDYLVKLIPLELDYLKITPDPAKPLAVGETRQFTAKGYNNGPNDIPEDGGGDDIEVSLTSLTWSVKGDPIGDITSTGFFTATAPGDGEIKAVGTVGTATQQEDDEVNQAAFGGEITGPTAICLGETIKLKAAENQPAGVKYKWIEGSDKIDFVDDTDADGIVLSTEEVEVKSLKAGAATVALKYTLDDKTVTDTHNLTVLPVKFIWLKFWDEGPIICKRIGKQKFLGAGDPSIGDAGIRFEGAAKIPAECHGTLQLVQNVKTNRVVAFTDGSKITLNTGERYVLDTKDPKAEGKTKIDDDLYTLADRDSPSIRIELWAEKAVVSTSAQDNFKLFLMWKPDRDKRKTLGLGTWGWGAGADSKEGVLHLTKKTPVFSKDGKASEEEPKTAPNVQRLYKVTGGKKGMAYKYLAGEKFDP